MKEEIMAHLRVHPGSTSSGINRAVRSDRSISDWIATRADLDRLLSDGLIEERQYHGVTVFFLKGQS